MAKTAMTGANNSAFSGTTDGSTSTNSAITIHGLENPSLQLTIDKLNGKNYLEWD